MLNNINGELLLHLLFLLITGLFIRILPIVLVPPAKASDTCFHYYLIKAIRENNCKIPEVYPRMPENIRLWYPPFLHYLLSYIPTRFIETLLKFMNPLLDVFVAITIFISLWVLKNDLIVSWLGALLYLFSPIIFTHQALGPRITDFTPRVFTECLFFLIIICMLMEDSPAFILIGGIISGFIFISSQFSSQAVLLTLPFAVLFGGSSNILLIPIIGFAFASVVGKKMFFSALKDKLYHYKWYFSQIRASKLEISKGRWIPKLEKVSIKNIYNELFTMNLLASLIIKMPIILYLVYFFDFPTFLMPYILASIALFILTSTKYFLFLGEAERYIIHYFPLFIVAASLTVNIEIILLFLAYGVLFYLFDIFMLYYKKRYAPSSHKAQLIIEYLNKLKEVKTIASNPLHLGGWRILSDTKHNVVSPWNSFQDKNAFFSSYTFLDEKELEKASQHYGFDLMFFDERDIKSLSGVREQLSQFKEVHLDYGIILFEKKLKNEMVSES